MVDIDTNCTTQSFITYNYGTSVLIYCMFGLSYERPILGNNLKAQSEMRRFPWNVALFIWKALHFSYEKRCTFHEKWRFSWKVQCFSYEKHPKSLKTADSTHICLLDLVFALFMKSVAVFVKSAAFRKTTCKEL